MTALPTDRAPRLSPAEFYTCWQSLGLGETPPLLQVRPPGVTMTEHRRLLASSISRLRRRHLYTHDGPAPELTHMLGVLARPDYTLDIRYTADPHTHLLGLGAVTGTHATLVTTNTNSGSGGVGALTLLRIDSIHVAARLLSLVGPITPGRNRVVNIPAESLDHARAAIPDNNPWSIAEHLQTLGVPRIDAHSFARMCTDIQAGGQLGATAHFHGPPRRGGWVIALHRNPAGHFMQLRRPDTAHPPTHTVGPADAALLTRHWRELLERLAATP